MSRLAGRGGWVAQAAVLLALGAACSPAQAVGEGCWVAGDRARLATRRSPLDSVIAPMGGGEIKVCYGRPSARGRTVMGGLVPFGTPWRLGADEATTLRLSVPVRIGELTLAAGVYSLYAVPGRDTWQLVVNRDAERWGIPISDAIRAQDVGGVTLAPEATDAPVEQLTMRLTPAQGGGLDLVIEWERTRLRVPIRPQ